MRVWDASQLYAEQVGQQKGDDTSNYGSKSVPKSTETVIIENEKNYNLRLNSSSTNKTSQLKPIDKRSDADSGIDEREFMTRSNPKK